MFTKGFEKTALWDQAIGYAVGHHLKKTRGNEEKDHEVDSTGKAVARSLFIPGYIGYRFGRYGGYGKAKKEHHEEHHKEHKKD